MSRIHLAFGGVSYEPGVFLGAFSTKEKAEERVAEALRDPDVPIREYL